MNKRKLFFAIGVIAVILLGSTFFALNQRGKEEKKEKKIGYLTASWEQNYTSMDELVKGSELCTFCFHVFQDIFFTFTAQKSFMFLSM